MTETRIHEGALDREESGRWLVLFRWLKGYVAPPHKHLSAAHTYILSGKLKVRGGTFNAGDYVHEANGMVHGAHHALEDTEYLFLCDGPVIFFGKDEFTGYLGWEEIRRMQQAHEASKKKAAARKRTSSKKRACHQKAGHEEESSLDERAEQFAARTARSAEMRTPGVFL